MENAMNYAPQGLKIDLSFPNSQMQNLGMNSFKKGTTSINQRTFPKRRNIPFPRFRKRRNDFDSPIPSCINQIKNL